jgi:serine/threonine protein kinase
MHRDLSLENIVISIQTNKIKLIDFGFAIEFTGGRSTAQGNLMAMAP